MKYICELCGWIYDEDAGDPHSNIKPGTKFQEFPDDYECPYCYSGREAFDKITEKA